MSKLKIPYSAIALVALICIIVIDFFSLIDVEAFVDSNTLDTMMREDREFDTNQKIIQVNLSASQLSFHFCGDKGFPCFDTYLNMLNDSKNSIQCAIQDLNDETLNRVLLEKYVQDVDIDIIVDERYSNRELVQELKNQNISILDDSSRNSGSYTNLMHEKFCVIDSKHVLFGSANPTTHGLKRNENVVFSVTNSTELAQEFMGEFNQLEKGVFGQEKLRGNFTNQKYNIINSSSSQRLAEFEVVFCPQENCGSLLRKILNSSQESIFFATFVLTLDDVEEVLISKAQEDVEVKGIVESRLINVKGSIIANMSQNFFQIKKENSTPTMHHKLFIIDEEIVVFGSLNPSASGAYYNDESVIILNSRYYAQEFVNEFDTLYEEGVSIE